MDKALEVVTDAKLMAADGGPVIMLQIENEFGNIEHNYPQKGAKYVQWAANYALRKNLSVPWMMCQQGEGVGTAPPAEVINTCNGYYCDNWIERHESDFPSQPHLWTENWPGWFQKWGEAVPHRPSVDVTFAVARWYAKGGSFMNYYMAFGGTSFGRHVGGPLIITSYDYDVQINEYVLPAEPKFSLTRNLHKVLHNTAPIILAHDSVPQPTPLTSTCEVHAYDQHADIGCISFLSNWGTNENCVFENIGGELFTVPAWSVSIVSGACGASPDPILLLNTKTDADSVKPTTQTPVEIPGMKLSPFEMVLAEPIPSSNLGTDVVKSTKILDQLALTNDETDYLWTSASFDRDEAGPASITFSISTDGGPVLYVFVNGKQVASSVANSVIIDKVTHYPENRQFGEGVENFTFDVTLVAGENHVDVLFASMGLQNYGPVSLKWYIILTFTNFMDSIWRR